MTHDIPPYAIAVGNPAKIIRYRLPDDIIEIVKDVFLKDIPEALLEENLEGLYTPLSQKEEAKRLIQRLKHEA